MSSTADTSSVSHSPGGWLATPNAIGSTSPCFGIGDVVLVAGCPAIDKGADLHMAGYDKAADLSSPAYDMSADVSSEIPSLDFQENGRPVGLGWDIGADEYSGTTAIRLASFRRWVWTRRCWWSG